MDWTIFIVMVLAGTAGAAAGMLIVRALRRRGQQMKPRR